MPPLAIWPCPPQISGQVFLEAWHHSCLMSSETLFTLMLQQGPTLGGRPGAVPF